MTLDESVLDESVKWMKSFLDESVFSRVIIIIIQIVIVIGEDPKGGEVGPRTFSRKAGGEGGVTMPKSTFSPGR